MKKKIAITLLVLCIALTTVFLTTACSGDTVTTETVPYTDENGVVYTLFKVTDGAKTDTYVKVTGYTGKTAGAPPANQVTVNILSEVEIEGTVYPVTAIGSIAFYGIDVTEINVPENVTSVEPFAFAYCGAGEINLPSTVKEIGEYAFVNCNSLRVLKINAVEPPVIGGYVFKFYNEKNNVYEITQNLTVRVPSASKDGYLNAWAEYASIIK